jgi:hypothetical protein
MIALGDSSHERGASRNGAGKKNCTVATKDIRSGLVIRMTASGYHHINFTSSITFNPSAGPLFFYS